MRDDQAAGLRRLFGPARQAVAAIHGVDTTPLVLDLGRALAELGRHVLVVDRTRGEAAALCGFRCRYELAHVLAHDVPIGAALHRVAAGLSILPAARGFDELALKSAGFRAALTAMLDPAEQPFDVWLVNGMLPASVDKNAELISLAPTGAAVTEAYARIKAQVQYGPRRNFTVVVQHARSEQAARALFESVAATARRFLSAHLDYQGAIPDRGVQRMSAARHHALLRLAENLLPAPMPC
jgi:flagellar biosynthesis protein FlhG